MGKSNPTNSKVDLSDLLAKLATEKGYWVDEKQNSAYGDWPFIDVPDWEDGIMYYDFILDELKSVACDLALVTPDPKGRLPCNQIGMDLIRAFKGLEILKNACAVRDFNTSVAFAIEIGETIARLDKEIESATGHKAVRYKTRRGIVEAWRKAYSGMGERPSATKVFAYLDEGSFEIKNCSFRLRDCYQDDSKGWITIEGLQKRIQRFGLNRGLED